MPRVFARASLWVCSATPVCSVSSVRAAVVACRSTTRVHAVSEPRGSLQCRSGCWLSYVCASQSGLGCQLWPPSTVFILIIPSDTQHFLFSLFFRPLETFCTHLTSLRVPSFGCASAASFDVRTDRIQFGIKIFYAVDLEGVWMEL